MGSVTNSVEEVNKKCKHSTPNGVLEYLKFYEVYNVNKVRKGVLEVIHSSTLLNCGVWINRH